MRIRIACIVLAVALLAACAPAQQEPRAPQVRVGGSVGVGVESAKTFKRN